MITVVTSDNSKLSKFIACTFFISSAVMVIIISQVLTFKILLAFLISIIGTIFIIINPFAGLAFIVLFSQLSVFEAQIFPQSLPTGTKLLTALVAIGVILNLKSHLNIIREQTVPKQLILLIMLFCVILISTFTAAYHDAAVDEFRRMTGMYLLCLLFIFAVNTEKKVELLLLIIMVSSIISSLVMYYEWSFGEYFLPPIGEHPGRSPPGYRSAGATGPGVSAPPAGMMVLCGVTLAAVLLLRSTQWRMTRITALLTIAIGSIGIILNGSRSMLIGYVGMAIILLFKFRRHDKFLLVLLAAMSALLMFFLVIPEQYWERMSQLFASGQDFTLDRRFAYQIIGIDLMAKNPVFGAGFGNFPMFFVDPDYRWLDGTRVEMGKQQELHNIYLQYGGESGILALLLYAGLLITCYNSLGRVFKKSCNNNIRQYSEAVQYSFLVLIYGNIFISDKFTKYIFVYIGLSMALHYINQAYTKNTPFKKILARTESRDQHDVRQGIVE